MACQQVCIFTLIAYVWFLSTVCFQKSPQIMWVRQCKRTLVAIVLLSTVLNQMLLQNACCVFFRCLFKLTASEDALSVIIYHTYGTCWTFYQLCFQLAKSHWLHLFVFSPLWALNVPKFITVNLSNAPSNCLPERMQHHIGCRYLTFPTMYFFSTYIPNGQSKRM